MPAQGTATYVPRTMICLGAIGARTPVGLTPESAAAAVRAGISNITEHPNFVDRDGETMRLVSDAILAPNVRLTERMTELLFSALLQLPRIGERDGKTVRTLMVLCTPEPRPGLPEDIVQVLGRAVMERFGSANLRVQSLPSGHAAGVLGFGIAAKAIEDGEADVAVVAGVDSYQDRKTLEWMEATGQLKSEVNRDGFFPGEGAGACLLASIDMLRSFGLQPIARVAAVSTALEPITILRHGQEEICVGEGLSAAFLGLDSVIKAGGRKIDDTYCDLNGQRYRSEELVYTILRAQHLSVDANNYLHPADCWGDVGAASGPLFAALAQAASRKAYSRGSRAALWAGSEGGRRAVTILDFPATGQRRAA